MHFTSRLLTIALVASFSIFLPLYAEERPEEIPLVSESEADELKATFEEGVTALNQRDLRTWLAMLDESIVYITPTLPTPAVGKPANRRVWQDLFDLHETLSFTPITPRFHISGTTGVAWGYYAFVAQPDDISINAVIGRYTATFIKVDGKWRAVMIHNSVLSQAN